jgi:hypothetical protein
MYFLQKKLLKLCYSHTPTIMIVLFYKHVCSYLQTILMFSFKGLSLESLSVKSSPQSGLKYCDPIDGRRPSIRSIPVLLPFSHQLLSIQSVLY